MRQPLEDGYVWQLRVKDIPKDLHKMWSKRQSERFFVQGQAKDNCSSTTFRLLQGQHCQTSTEAHYERCMLGKANRKGEPLFGDLKPSRGWNVLGQGRICLFNQIDLDVETEALAPTLTEKLIESHPGAP